MVSWPCHVVMVVQNPHHTSDKNTEKSSYVLGIKVTHASKKNAASDSEVLVFAADEVLTSLADSG